MTTITVYRYSGEHWFFSIPHRWCEECDLSVSLAQAVAQETVDVQVVVKSWFTRLWEVLPKGGWHPPVVTVDGKVLTQGIVPSRARLAAAVREAQATEKGREDTYRREG